MTERIIKVPTEVMNYVDQVRHLADANRSMLGFVPASAYREAALKGCLWIAVDQTTQDLMGYLFFGGTYPHLKVFQIYVDREFRSVGMARALIEELKKHGESTNHLTITARVAAELEANKFWRRAGFRVVDQVRGGGKTRRTINIYLFELDAPSLFREYQRGVSSSSESVQQITYPFRPILQTPSYVLDLNVFFDIVANRGTGESARILSSALSNEIRLSVTSEFVRELERHSQNFDNDPVLEFAKKLPTLPELASNTLTILMGDISNILSPNPTKTGYQSANKVSDLIHLASCIHHRAYGFVTRDGEILQRSADLYERYNLRIVSPADLCEPYGDTESPPPPVTVAVGQSEVSVSALDEADRTEAERFLDQLGLGSGDASSCLASGTTQDPRVRQVVRAEKEIVGIGSWCARSRVGQDTLTFLYINEGHPNYDSAIGCLLESSMDIGSYGRLCRVDLRTSPRQIKTREVAISRGFRPMDHQEGRVSDDLTKFSLKGMVTGDNWASFRREFEDMTDLELPCKMPTHEELANTGVFLREKAIARKLTALLFDFETLISPGKLICSGRSAVMIPIRDEYASELLMSTVSQAPLFPKEAALRLERAYFSGAGRHGLLSRGKIAVFYVSRKRKEAVAAARITFSGSLTKTQAVLNLGRQGVLTEQEIRQKANSKGEITVFTFDNVIVFPKPIAYRELKEMGCIGGANLVTAQEVSHESLCRIVERAFER